MPTTGNILIVDDNTGALSALELLLEDYFDHIKTLSHPDGMLTALAKKKYHVVLLDMNFNAGVNSGNEGFYWLDQIKANYPDISVVMFTAYGDVELAVKAVKDGATDFLLKPWDNSKMIITLRNAAKLTMQQDEVSELNEKNTALKKAVMPEVSSIIGKSKPMEEMKTLIQKVGATDASVLITGENGTGKEMVARSLHACSPRAKQLMVSVDMGAIAESLFESELFGHVKGSFTDAKEDRIGKIEMADKGTLFLDEIGNIPLNLQAKLLTAIQTQTIYKVGSNKPIKVDFRLISATNNNLNQMVEEQLFRQDLLFRINTIQVEVPALRQRGNDVVLIANYYLDKLSKKYKKNDLKLSAEATERLKTHTWPGNVRELEHAIEKAVILSDSNEIESTLFSFQSAVSSPSFDTDMTIEEMERELIKSSVDQYGDNLSAVAKKLGITRQTLYNKLKKYQI
ncbi:sigma-54-dependent transcriptional regulator [Saccharicrinis aurantiacus]|uniref:sigma-54-dependent transcriptional regulator n=1 Tax=Saccharicrinis aurantiacus TaxID=1849719 RepID=UPI00094FDC30|nr:sigma-54 dependent transcriptional regulator [Saccharicrinis aurantiacus]